MGMVRSGTRGWQEGERRAGLQRVALGGREIRALIAAISLIKGSSGKGISERFKWPLG